MAHKNMKMHIVRIRLLLLATMMFYLKSFSQQADSSLVRKVDGDTSNTKLLKLDAKNYASQFAYNFKHQALFPLYLRGNDWVKFGGYALISGAVALANEPVKDFAIDLHNDNKGVANASKYITRFGGSYGVYTLGGLLATGFAIKDQKLKTTALLATQSYIISNLIGGGVKALTSVQGPFYTDPITNKTGPYFHGPFYTLKKGPDGKKLKSTNYVSFPSGHTYTAFSIATVFAMEYKDKPFIPIFCYGLAGLVGLSRLTENRHWAMDIIPGALLGYYSAKQVVKNYHRNAHGAKKKVTGRSTTLTLDYVNNQLVPGIVYKF